MHCIYQNLDNIYYSLSFKTPSVRLINSFFTCSSSNGYRLRVAGNISDTIIVIKKDIEYPVLNFRPFETIT